MGGRWSKAWTWWTACTAVTVLAQAGLTSRRRETRTWTRSSRNSAKSPTSKSLPDRAYVAVLQCFGTVEKMFPIVDRVRIAYLAPPLFLSCLPRHTGVVPDGFRLARFPPGLARAEPTSSRSVYVRTHGS